jgi:hypothetical protein
VNAQSCLTGSLTPHDDPAGWPPASRQGSAFLALSLHSSQGLQSHHIVVLSRDADTLRAGGRVEIPGGLTSEALEVLNSALAADEEHWAYMSHLRTKKTGVSNTIFLSQKYPEHHYPRIKIAIDRPG